MQQVRKAKGKALMMSGVAPKGATTPRPKAGPVRQCIVCRQVRPTWELLQFAAAGRTGLSKASRRNAYACISLRCLQGLGTRGWVRALDGSAEPGLSAEALLVALQDMAAQRLHGLLGLARRQGTAVLGAGRLSDTPPQGLDLVITTADVAWRTARQLSAQGHQVVAVPFLTALQLGLAVGGAPLAALGFRSGRLGIQAAYWLRVWYEAQSQGAQWEPIAAAMPPQQPGKRKDDTAGIDEARTARRIEVAR